MKITLYFPGAFLSETTDVEVKNIDELDIPKSCFCLKIPKQEGLCYFGSRYTLQNIKDDSETQKDKYRILISNMESNGWDEVVKCITGNFQPLLKSDKVFKDKEEFIRFLKLQKINEKSNSHI